MIYLTGGETGLRPYRCPMHAVVEIISDTIQVVNAKAKATLAFWNVSPEAPRYSRARRNFEIPHLATISRALPHVSSDTSR